MRTQFIGRISASQAEGAGSIPVVRSIFFLPKNPQATCAVLAAQAARTVQAALVMLSKLMNYQISANIFCLFVGKIKAGMNLCQRYCNTLYEMLKFPTNASKNVGKTKMEC